MQHAFDGQRAFPPSSLTPGSLYSGVFATRPDFVARSFMDAMGDLAERRIRTAAIEQFLRPAGLPNR
jgi:hypothetical protein